MFLAFHFTFFLERATELAGKVEGIRARSGEPLCPISQFPSIFFLLLAPGLVEYKNLTHSHSQNLWSPDCPKMVLRLRTLQTSSPITPRPF